MPWSFNPYAVIDIGSNSVRMVVYHALSRVPMPLFNEKYYCGLARDLERSGKLHAEGKEKARQAIARFVLMLERFEIRQAMVIATAAIRDAEDGAAFVDALEREFAISVQIIEGEREAELAAYGIIASVWQPSGLCADLGGGSLELAQIEDDRVLHTTSLPLGTLRLQQTKGKPGELRDTIRRALENVSWLREQAFAELYAIGGSFRSIAKMHRQQHFYPLRQIHEYRLRSSQMEQIARELATLSPQRLEDIPGIARRRAATIAVAAMVLDEIARYAVCENICFSVAGIREGLIYDQLSAAQRKEDPLMASAGVLSKIAGRRGRYAKELFDWMQPLFTQAHPAQERLRRALCEISEIAWTIDPNFRAEWSYLRILQSDMKGMTHPERVMLALAMAFRHAHKWKKPVVELALLQEEELVWARLAGQAAGLAFQLSGGQAGNLHHAPLQVEPAGRICLKLNDVARPLYTETVEKRLAGLTETLRAFG